MKFQLPTILRKIRTGSASQSSHLALGKKGEILAGNYIVQHGYRIIATNFILPIGYSLSGRQITGEIDIIAYDESSEPYTLAFIEVKTRTSTDIAAPEAAVDLRKQRQIIRTSKFYRRLMAVEDEPYRYDVVSIVARQESEALISLFRGYFNENRFANSGLKSPRI